MDVSFTNVLAGARQYFQGLPVPSTATDTAQSHSLTTTTSSTYNKNESTSGTSNPSKDTYPCSYWNPTEELRVVEPSAPQPTKVEVADTRPTGESAPSLSTELTEMQPSVKRSEYKQLPKTETPVYQQLRNQQYSTERTVYPQRTQYYPRYHHPDITKSSPLPQGSTTGTSSVREPRSSSQDDSQRLYPNSVGYPSASYNRATPSVITNTHPLSSASSSSHIPAVHIPQHLPVSSSSQPSYQARPESAAPSADQVHYAQAPSSQYPVLHNVAPFQPHSPTYPPPSPRPLPYSVPSPGPQQYPQSYPTYPASQSSYHSFQKSSSQSSSYYPVARHQQPGGYPKSNGEMKRPEVYPYQQPQRPETHNLPPIAAFSSYHPTRPATPAVNKSQPSLQRQRKEPTVANGRVPTPTYPQYSQSFTSSSQRANSTATQSFSTVASVASHRNNSSAPTYTSSESREGFKDYPLLSSLPAQPSLSRANGTAIKKRESPLDLSVKTVKTSADSTAQDLDFDQDKNHPMLPPQVPYPANGRVPVGRPVCAPKVEFYPDFNSAPMRNSQQRLQTKQGYQPLPHMSSFKKSSLPAPNYESLPRSSRQPAAIENKIADYYPKEPLKRDAPFSMGGPSNKYPKVDWDKKLPPKEQLKRHNSPAPPNGHLVAPAQFDQRNEQYALEAHRYPNLCDKKNYPDVMNPSFGHPASKSSAFAAIPASGTITYPTYRPENKAYVPPTGGVPTFEHPGNSGADKRILSLLRNNLENKQKEEFYVQQPGLANHNQSFQNKVVAPVEPKTNIGRHNLSPFTAASLLERNSNTPPHYKFYVPKAVDSITQDGPRGNYTRVNPATTLTSKDDLLSPRDALNQIYRDKDDGLAAILAAKIRTKAELKQVNLSHNVWRSTTSLPQEGSVTPKDVDGASTSTPHSSSSAGSPPKLTREKTPVAVPRRRLFSKSEEESLLLSGVVPGGSSAVPPPSISPRAIGPRSSSEASVFDFRESDSEGEMPVLERQTLEGMRRDRKQLSKVQPPMPLDDAMGMGAESSQDLVKIELRENEKATESDPFWSATCDKFMEQLRYGDSNKKRGRRKKSDVTTPGKIEAPVLPAISPENIKQEVLDEATEQSKITLEPPKLSPMQIKKEPEDPVPEEQPEEVPNKSPEVPPKDPKSSGDESDEMPLIKRNSKKKMKIEDDDEDDIVPVRKHATRRGSRIKLESSSENESSSEESDPGITTSVAERLRNRKQGIVETGGKMKLRSRESVQKPKTEVKTPQKTVAQKGKPKPLFGDGSDFRPGWEEEVYVYKKSLRMPTRLITVSKPSRFHRLSTSLPDLDPASPALSVSMDSSDVYLNRKRGDSDLESNCSFSMKNDDEEATSSTTVSCPTKLGRGRSDGPSSIVDVLAQKVGTGKKELKKKGKEKEKEKDKEVPKILKKSNEPELLPTPSLAPLLDEESPTKKGKSPLKKSAKPIKVTDSFLLGYFRKETVNNFRDAFKNNHTVPNEFSTLILKSRTRTETRVMKKQATIKEVFGEDRPASAPPMQNHAGDTSQDDDSQNESKTTSTPAKSRTLKEKVVSRLRNAGILKSSKDKVVKEEKEKEVKKEKESPMKKRRKEIKSMPDKKLKKGKKEVKEEDEVNEDNDEVNEEEDEEEEEEPEEEDEDEETTQENNEAETETIEDGGEAQTKRKLKFRSEKFRKKRFRSGFDYIRKKKKPPLKKDEVSVPKERKRQGITRSNPECVADIQAEIRTWVIKKGVGETILHRAARLGYTDVAAYCLEKLNCAPNPKDNAGYTPLHEACSRGHLEIAKLLLAYGANVSESANGGIRPLHEAAENGDAELVRLLLSYGADPLLATYGGQTPLALAADSEAYRVLEQHIDDIQGRRNVPWHFQGPSSLFDPQKSGFDPLDNAPDDMAESELDEVEMEVSDVNLPVLFTLMNEADKWILLPDLMTALKVKSRDALLRQVNPKAPSGPPSVAHREVMREMKLADFLEQSRCCHLMSAGEKINVRGSKVTLIKYNERVRSLLNVERVVISLR